MTESRKEFFCTEELHHIHPELAVREGSYTGKDYVVFHNPKNDVDIEVPEWPVGLELWVEHEHERGVDGEIYDPLRFYFDRRGLTELLTGKVYGEIGTMAEVLTQHLYGGYMIDVMFGQYFETNDETSRFLVKTPYEVDLSLNDKDLSTNDKFSAKYHVLIRVMSDKRLCAVNSVAFESCSFLYRSIQYSNDGFRRYEFLVHPLADTLFSTQTQIFSAKDYVHFYAAMYDSCIMLAHHDQAR